ncbi:MAG: hypothetical protein M3P45_00285 [Acidobacteriota bacterium]|nr:hypothetical protein [Acidobacteriota bacterium]
MDQRPEQIEQYIRHQRSELEDNFSELEDKVRGAFDWRTQFEERPAVMLGAAFAGGVLLAAIMPGTASITQRVTSRRRSFNDSYSPYSNREAPAEPVSTEAASKSYAAYTGAAQRRTSETWENVKSAAIGVGMSWLTEFVEQLVPGFTDHYKKAASGKPTSGFGGVPTPQENNWQKPNGGTDYASHS